MILKNRYGAGGDYVFRIYSKKELINYYNISKLNLFNPGAARFFLGMLGKRIFYWSLIKARKADYPFLSPPLLAQKYVKMDRDLKTVTGDFAVVEGPTGASRPMSKCGRLISTGEGPECGVKYLRRPSTFRSGSLATWIYGGSISISS